MQDVITEETTAETWAELEKRITTARESNSKIVAFIMDEDGWLDVSDGVPSLELLRAVTSWKQFIEKETQSMMSNEEYN